MGEARGALLIGNTTACAHCVCWLLCLFQFGFGFWFLQDF